MFGPFETILCFISGAAAFLFFWQRQKTRESGYAVGLVKSDGGQAVWHDDAC